MTEKYILKKNLPIIYENKWLFRNKFTDVWMFRNKFTDVWLNFMSICQ